jgi:hypothetical protein
VSQRADRQASCVADQHANAPPHSVSTAT